MPQSAVICPEVCAARPASRGALPALTGVRFFAAMHVVFYHYVPAVPPLFRWVVLNGYMAVGLFFVLSGFVLAYTYGDRRLNLRGFWIARLARVYPAYLLAFVASGPAVVLRWVHQDPRILVRSGLAGLFLVQGWFPSLTLIWNGPGWSLSNEAFFYALFPAILFGAARLSRRGLRIAFAGTWMVALLPPVLALATERGLAFADRVTFCPACRLAEFAMGVVAGLLYLRGESLRAAGMAPAAGILAMFCPPVVPEIARCALVAPLFALLIFGLSASDTWFTRMLSRPLFSSLGNASYAIYILQSPVFAFFLLATQGIRSLHTRATLNWPQFSGLCLTLIGVSWLCFVFIETPARRYLVRGQS